jgi:hypothetical protein
MTVSSAQLHARLSCRDPDLLRAVLEASDVAWRDDDGASELAGRLVKALWWRTHSPAGQAIRPDSLDDLVDRYGQRLEVHLPTGDVYGRLQALAVSTLPATDEPLDLETLDPSVKQKLQRPVWGRLAGATGSGGAFGAGWVARRVLQGTIGPIWMLLAKLPYVGPFVIGVRSSAGTVLSLSGPVGIGLALLTLNSALGPRYDRGLPLLVGAGLVLRDLPARVGGSDQYAEE